MILEVIVGTDGTPKSVTVKQSSGFRELDRAAMESVQKVRFNPEIKNGKPVESTVDIPITFNLNQL